MDPILEVAKALAPDPEVPGLTLRWGVITGVNSDGSASLRLGGSAVVSTTVKALGSYHPVVNDVVCVLTNGPDLIIIGTVAPTGPGELWIPAKDFDAALGSPTYPLFGSWAAAAWGWQFPHGVGAYGIIGHRFLPSDYVPATTVNVDVYYQGGGSGNFQLSMQASARTPGTPGDDIRSTGGSATNTTIASYNGLAVVLAGCTVSDSPAAGDLINIAVARDSNNAADTSTNVMVFFGCRIRYTRYRL